MDDENPFDRFDDVDDLLDRFEEVFGPEFDQIRDLMDRMVEDLEEADLRSDEPFVYGFTVRMGPDGTPDIDGFGNVRDTPAGVDVDPDAGTREPLTDVIEGPEEVSVTAELPGVGKDDIQLTVTPTQAKIHVDGENRRYYKTVDLPGEVDPDTTQATYRNGVLDITITRVEDDSGRRIEID